MLFEEGGGMRGEEVTTGVVTGAELELAYGNKDYHGCKGKEPIRKTERCCVEITCEWRVDDSEDTGERERHSTPQVAVVQLIAGKETVLAATLQDVCELHQHDGQVGHCRCAHV